MLALWPKTRRTMCLSPFKDGFELSTLLQSVEYWLIDVRVLIPSEGCDGNVGVAHQNLTQVIRAVVEMRDRLPV